MAVSGAIIDRLMVVLKKIISSFVLFHRAESVPTTQLIPEASNLVSLFYFAWKTNCLRDRDRYRRVSANIFVYLFVIIFTIDYFV